jgi:GTPase SAR1 family protein
MAITRLDDLKRRLTAALGAVADLADRAGTPSLARRLRDERLPRLAEERALLVVVGELDRGKTSLVNCLLGAPLLPVGPTPTTAHLCEVRWGARPSAALVCGEPGGAERREVVPLGRLAELTCGGAAPADLLRVEVETPAPLLESRITVVDTPGVNDLDHQRAEITYGYLPRADAILLVLDATQPLTASEKRFITDRLLPVCRDRLVVALNKADLASEAEGAEALRFVREQLVRVAPVAPVVLTSAVRGRAGEAAEGDDGGLQALGAHLAATLGSDRLRLVLDGAAAEGLRACDLVAGGVALRRRSLGLGPEELARRTAALEADLEASAAKLEERRGRIAAEVAALRGAAHEDLRRFTADLAAALPAQVGRATAADIRTYYRDFIEDTFRAWLEEEARTVGGRLEALADSLVAVLDEDARAAAAALGGGVRDGAQGLDLRVDTSRYDVSVVALGALGMGVMLFSNLLVGGLLTLAAPALATFFRWRVDEEVKRKAVEEGPAAVRAVAARVAPELDRIITESGGRLEELARTAGGEVRRAYLEALAAARAAHETASAESGPAVAEVDALAAEVRARRTDLEVLRAGVWAEESPPQRPGPASA